MADAGDYNMNCRERYHRIGKFNAPTRWHPCRNIGVVALLRGCGVDAAGQSVALLEWRDE